MRTGDGRVPLGARTGRVRSGEVEGVGPVGRSAGGGDGERVAEAVEVERDGAPQVHLAGGHLQQQRLAELGRGVEELLQLVEHLAGVVVEELADEAAVLGDGGGWCLGLRRIEVFRRPEGRGRWRADVARGGETVTLGGAQIGVDEVYDG